MDDSGAQMGSKAHSHLTTLCQLQRLEQNVMKGQSGTVNRKELRKRLWRLLGQGAKSRIRSFEIA
jgi:hypothetical protein